MTRLEALRDAYVADEIDVETFERFAGMILAGEELALPDAVEFHFRQAQVRFAATDKPGQVFAYAQILKQAWTETSS